MVLVIQEKVKSKSDGTIDRYKVRVVAFRYKQQEGKGQYDETFSPVIKMATKYRKRPRLMRKGSPIGIYSDKVFSFRMYLFLFFFR